MASQSLLPPDSLSHSCGNTSMCGLTLPGGVPAGLQPGPQPDREGLFQAEAGACDWAARTVEGVYEGLRRIITRFGPAECLNYFRHCGYAPATAA